MTLLYCPTAVVGGTRYYLPPHLEIDFDRGQTVENFPIPQTNQNLITTIRPNLGTKIGIKAAGWKSSRDQATVNAWIEEVWANLKGVKFDLYIFNDHAWKNCAVERFTHAIGLSPYGHLQAGFSCHCEKTEADYTTQLSFADYATEYPYAAIVGRPGGVVTVTNPVATEPAMQTNNGQFNGMLSAITVSGSEHRFRVGGATGSQWRLEGLQITSAEPFSADGTTSLKVGTGVVGTGSTITNSVTVGQKFSSETTGSITVTAGDTLYVYCSAAGNHTNVQYRVRLKAL